MLKRKWSNKFNSDLTLCHELSKELDIPFLTSRILVSRGYESKDEINEFLNPSINHLKDPFLFKDMEKTVNRIRKAIENKEKIWIFGDYDVDGITSISILYNYFKSINYPVEYYIPNRQKEGYGLSKVGIDEIFNNQGNLIITVDCGITANDLTDYCNSLNMDIIITDHHKCGDSLPKAYSILNPKVVEDQYPFDMLAGCGIALKLVQGLSGTNFKNIYKQYIDIAAFGTVADIVPLNNENRVITKLGIERLNTTENIGLKALIETSDLSDKEISSGMIGYRLAPQINAAGRLGDPELGVELLTSDDNEKVKEIAATLKGLNEQRKLIEKAIFIKSKKFIEENIDLDQEKIIIVYGENWHSGVIGIVASRITETYGKPAIVLSKEEAFVKGSARSVGAFNIHEALKANADYLIGFGGHKMAAGLTMSENQVSNFREAMNDYITVNIDPEKLIPVLKYEGDLTTDDINLKTIQHLDKLKPFGIGNSRPQFKYSKVSVIDHKTVGSDNSHLKVILSKDGFNIDAIGFSMGHFNEHLNRKETIDALVTLDINEYNGLTTPQLMLKDLHVASVEKEAEASFKDLYFKTLYKSIKNNLSYFTNIKFDQVKIECDTIEDINKKTLILVNSINSLNAIGEDKYDKWSFNFNTIKETTGKDILINPVLKNIKINNYEQIIFYDIPIRKKANKLIAFLNEERLGNLKNIFKEIPDKDELVLVYKNIVKNQHVFLNRTNELLGMSKIKLLLAIEILKEIKIIDFNLADEKISIEMLPKPSKKVKLEEHEVFKKMQVLKGKVM
jgi:single-stranded-DNA-specific exonuclease